MILKSLLSKATIIFVSIALSMQVFARDVWTAEQANAWFAKQPYRAGVNYIPAYAISLSYLSFSATDRVVK